MEYRSLNLRGDGALGCEAFIWCPEVLRRGEVLGVTLLPEALYGHLECGGSWGAMWD